MYDHLLPHLHSAAQVLSSQEAPFRARLVEAGSEFWTAVASPEQWPADLRRKANRLLDRLLEGGTVEATVAQMDSNTANEVAKGILDLAAAIEAVENERRHSIHR